MRFFSCSIFRVLSTVVFSSVIVGCSFSKDPGGKEKNAGDPAAQVPMIPNSLNETGDNITFDELVVSYLPNPEPNSYRARISWPKGKKTKISIGRQESFITAETSKTDFQEFNCPGGNEQIMGITIYPSGSSVPSGRFSINLICPTDLIVNDVIQYKEKVKKFGRIFFSERGVLNFNGNSIKVEANTIIIKDHSRIITFSNDQVFDQFSIRPAPPSIEIIANEIINANPNDRKAVLDIELIGLKGADGLSGDELAVKNVAFQAELKKNRKGIDGLGFVQARRHSCKSHDGSIIESCPLLCDQKPTNGGPGLDGVEGLRGGEGGAGMDSPKLKLKVERSEGVFVNIFAKPGAGGDGGLGGSPIPPGQGGRAGETHPEGCPEPTRAGNPGKEAKPGEAGFRGKNGIVNLSCGNPDITVTGDFEYKVSTPDSSQIMVCP